MKIISHFATNCTFQYLPYKIFPFLFLNSELCQTIYHWIDRMSFGIQICKSTRESSAANPLRPDAKNEKYFFIKSTRKLRPTAIVIQLCLLVIVLVLLTGWRCFSRIICPKDLQVLTMWSCYILPLYHAKCVPLVYSPLVRAICHVINQFFGFNSFLTHCWSTWICSHWRHSLRIQMLSTIP